MPDIAYLDTFIFLHLLQKKAGDQFDACESLWQKAVRKDLVIVTSALTIAEVNRLTEDAALREDESKLILRFFQHSAIVIRPVDRLTAEHAHELTRTHGLYPAGAIHAATADLARVSVLYTYDAAKKRRRGLLKHHLKLGNPPLRIEKPPDPKEGTVFDPKNAGNDEGK